MVVTLRDLASLFQSVVSNEGHLVSSHSFGHASKTCNSSLAGRADTVGSCLTSRSFHGTRLQLSHDLGLHHLHRHGVFKTAGQQSRSPSRRWAVCWLSKGPNRPLFGHSLCPSSVSIPLTVQRHSNTITYTGQVIGVCDCHSPIDLMWAPTTLRVLENPAPSKPSVFQMG